MSQFNLIEDPLIRFRAADTCVDHLPGVFAALLRDEVESFPALRPHQRHAWHAFLTQVGALALLCAGLSDLPEEDAQWAALLRGLTPGFQDDEPWCLVSPPEKPALLQAPLPGGKLDDLKNLIETPDSLDVLITAKNHDLKSSLIKMAEPDDWLFALVTLQTMEGFLGAGNYGISRMNGGFANRAALGIVPGLSLGRHLRRDIARLIALRRENTQLPYPVSGGLGLVWLRPWDGASSLRPEELDAYYVEICRRVRFIDHKGKLAARVGGSKVPRIVPTPGGLTGDPWAPLMPDKKAGGNKVYTADAQGFGYRRIVDLMFSGDVVKSALQVPVAGDDKSGLSVLARALVRGQGKTEGYHERRVPISASVKGRLSRPETADKIAKAANERVALAGEIQNKVLKPALLALFENGPETIDYKNKGASQRAEAFLTRFDEDVDRDFFSSLWREFEEGAEQDSVRGAWVRDLLARSKVLVKEADEGASKATARRYKARARADAVLAGAPRRNQTISPYIEERS